MWRVRRRQRRCRHIIEIAPLSVCVCVCVQVGLPVWGMRGRRRLLCHAMPSRSTNACLPHAYGATVWPHNPDFEASYGWPEQHRGLRAQLCSIEAGEFAQDLSVPSAWAVVIACLGALRGFSGRLCTPDLNVMHEWIDTFIEEEGHGAWPPWTAAVVRWRLKPRNGKRNVLDHEAGVCF